MLGSLFKPVPQWDMDQAKQYMESHTLNEYTLIDVRQPEEFAEGHIPGATSIPLGELPQRLDEIDRNKLTLLYCRSGGRAGNATALLNQAGFDQAHSIGGIAQWRGMQATGAPEAGMIMFDAARKPEDYVALAWSMEENAKLFYLTLADTFPALKEKFQAMAAGEARHGDRLALLHRDVTGKDGAPNAQGAESMMEGGVDRGQALAWAKQADVADVIDFAATMEANAHDRYIQVARALGGAVEQTFLELAHAEKAHFAELMKMLRAR